MYFWVSKWTPDASMSCKMLMQSFIHVMEWIFVAIESPRSSTESVFAQAHTLHNNNIFQKCAPTAFVHIDKISLPTTMMAVREERQQS